LKKSLDECRSRWNSLVAYLSLKKRRIMVNNHDDTEECKYTWNDVVTIKKEVPVEFHPGEIGVICGMSQIKFEDVGKKYHSKLGNWIYTVEFSGGSDIQIPEIYLEKYQDKESNTETSEE
jgi:hypothetical protein